MEKISFNKLSVECGIGYPFQMNWSNEHNYVLLYILTDNVLNCAEK